MKRILVILLCLMTSQVMAQLGLGTNDPKGGLHVVDSSVVFSANHPVLELATVPVIDAGRRMLWYSDQAAFRVGSVDTYGRTYWDISNLGFASLATGENTRAAGAHSFAIGLASTATGDGSVALGVNGTANANQAIAFNGTTNQYGAVAIGLGAQAFGPHAQAWGPSSLASGMASINIGPSVSLGNYSVAIGLQSSTTGSYTIAIGKNARTAGRNGSMVLGDGSAPFSRDSVYATANDQFVMRGASGIRFFTDASSDTPAGVELSPGGGAWSMVSDRNQKENFLPIGPMEAELLLQKLATIPVSRWNYKNQASSRQHLGPMAQDFQAAFGLNGPDNDTTINSVDMDGLSMAAIQALERRTGTLQEQTRDMTQEVDVMNQRLLLLINQLTPTK